MADLEFVDPSTGAALGAHAFGTVAAGMTSAAWTAKLRYKDGQSGSGLDQNALVLEVSTDGGATWQTDLTEFTIQVTATTNVPNDPLFYGTTTAARRTTRLDLPPLRAGCSYTLAITFSPTLRTGAATTAYSWRLGVLYNEASRQIDLVPGAPTGILTGLGDISISEWVTAGTLTNDTDKVTLGGFGAIVNGRWAYYGGGDVALDQNDVDVTALSSGEEYVAVISMDQAGTVTATKGVLDTAGDAVQPAFPAGQLALAVVRVPYGGVIVTSTLLAVSGRCEVADTTGLVVSIQPGRAMLPGFYLTPRSVQLLTLADDTTSTVYLSSAGVANVVEGVPLAEVVTSGGDITGVTDLRRLLYPEAPTRMDLPGVETIATNVARFYRATPWTLEKAFFYARVAAAGASGVTKVHVYHEGNGVFADEMAAGGTSQGTGLLTLAGGPGWFTADIDTITTSGTQAEDIEVLLWLAEV